MLQFAGAKVEYNTKHDVYFRLHQEMQAHRRDLAGLKRAAQLADSPGEAARWEAQVWLCCSTVWQDIVPGLNTHTSVGAP